VVTTNSVNVTYTYDYTGRLAKKVGPSGTTRRYYSQYAEASAGYLTKHYFANGRIIASYRYQNTAFGEATPGASLPPEPIVVPLAVVGSFAALVALLLAGPGRRPIRLGVAVARTRAAGCRRT
jgi:hypothetical protein